MTKDQNKVSQGVSLLAIGKPIFFDFAFNMALSLRKHSPGVQIQLIHDHYIKEMGAKSNIFDVLTPIDRADCTENKRIQAGKAKCAIYKYLHFDETLYLDVDGVLLQDITPLFNQEQDFKIQKDALHWVEDQNILKDKYRLKDKVHGSNSSVMFIRKSENVKKMFADAFEFLVAPIEYKIGDWFKMLPDELFIGISLSQNRFKNIYFDTLPVYFRRRIDYHRTESLEDVKNDYFVVGTYGNTRYNHGSVYTLYDKENRLNWKTLLKISPRKEIRKLMRNKR